MTLPFVFLITVIFMVISLNLMKLACFLRKVPTQSLATSGSSSSQGHCDTVLTLPFVFLMTVIFMANS